jgi:AGZA family xanthine/uracil permease-like MFS transporter
MTLFMGLYAKLPFAVAPGMGINAYFTFTIILTQKVWWQVALGIIFWAGVLFLVISVIPLTFSITQGILWPVATAPGSVFVDPRRLLKSAITA